MIILDATTKSLQIKLSAAVTANQLPFAASYVDATSTATTPGEQDGTSNGTTAVTIVSSPAASTPRLVKNIVIQNADTASAKVTVIYNNNSTLRNIIVATLAVGDQFVYEDGSGWSTIDTNGNLKTTGSGGGGGAVSSVSNSDTTLTISPTTGNVVASLGSFGANTVLANASSSSAQPTGVSLSASQLLGRGSTGNIAAITLGSNLSMSGTTLSATGGGSAATGTMFNLQQGQLTTPFTTSASSYTAITGLDVSITPTSSSNTVLVRVALSWSAGNGDQCYFQLLRNSTPIGIGTSVGSRTAASTAPSGESSAGIFTEIIEWLDTPATTSAVTYSVQGFSNGGTGLAINQRIDDSNSSAYPRAVSTITVCEVVA